MLRRPAPRTAVSRALRRAAVVTCACLTVSLTAGVSLADVTPGDKERVQQEKSDADSRVQGLTGHLNETDAQLSSAYLALQETQSRLPGAEAELRRAQDAEAAAIADEQRARTAVEVAQAREGRARDELAATIESIETSRTDVARFAAQIYQEQGGVGELAIAMEATTPQEFADRLALVDTVMDVQHGQIGRLTTAKADKVAQEALLEALRVEKEEAQAEAQAALQRAGEARVRADDAKRVLDNLAAQQQAQTAELENQKAATQQRLDQAQADQSRLEADLKEIARQEHILEQERLAKIERERQAKIERDRQAQAERDRQAQAERDRQAQRDRDAQAERDRQAQRDRDQASRSNPAPVPAPAPAPAPAPGPAPPPAPSAVLTRPCPSGCWVSSEFGMRLHPILNYTRLHSGRDYAGNTGTPIVAAASGTIISAGWSGAGGNTIRINHGIVNGVNIVTSYLHLNGFAVRGGSVSRGQVIGYLGSTGLSTGPHLHFETYEDGVPVDPRRWL